MQLLGNVVNAKNLVLTVSISEHSLYNKVLQFFFYHSNKYILTLYVGWFDLVIPLSFILEEVWLYTVNERKRVSNTWNGTGNGKEQVSKENQSNMKRIWHKCVKANRLRVGISIWQTWRGLRRYYLIIFKTFDAVIKDFEPCNIISRVEGRVSYN